MNAIVTVTPNPAIDVTYVVDDLVPDTSHRVRRVVERPGGKGVNVARVVQALGHDIVPMVPVGGPSGSWFTDTLRESGLSARTIPVGGATRRSIAVRTEETVTVFNEPGPELSAADWSVVVRAVEAELPGAGVLVVSGSVPPGTPAQLHATLISRGHDAGVPVVADTSGPPLLAAASAGADLVKPNAAELQEVTGTDDVVTGARRLLDAGAGGVLVSLGADGMLAVTADECIRVTVPVVSGGNPTGAGDAVVAALSVGMTDGQPWHYTLARAAALGTAAVVCDVAGEVDLAAFDQYLSDVTVEHIDDSHSSG